jgi:hypothetical protein
MSQSQGRLSRFRQFKSPYGYFCGALLFFLFLFELRGWGFDPGDRHQIPASVRQSPGGYRSYHFWHRGLHGGK